MLILYFKPCTYWQLTLIYILHINQKSRDFHLGLPFTMSIITNLMTTSPGYRYLFWYYRYFVGDLKRKNGSDYKVKWQLKITHRDISKIYINRDPIDNDHLPDFILLSSAKVLTFKFWWFYFLKNWEKIYYTDKNMNFEHMDSFYVFRRKPRVGK